MDTEHTIRISGHLYENSESAHGLQSMPSYLIIAVSGPAASLRKRRRKRRGVEERRRRSKMEEEGDEERPAAGCIPQNNASFYNHWA